MSPLSVRQFVCDARAPSVANPGRILQQSVYTLIPAKFHKNFIRDSRIMGKLMNKIPNFDDFGAVKHTKSHLSGVSLAPGTSNTFTVLISHDSAMLRVIISRHSSHLRSFEVTPLSMACIRSPY